MAEKEIHFVTFPKFKNQSNCLERILLGLRQFLVTEITFKMIKNYSPQKLFWFSRYLNFCLVLGHVEKQLDLKDQINFQTYDVTTWETNNFQDSTHLYLKK